VAGFEFAVVVRADSVKDGVTDAETFPTILESRIDIFPTEIEILSGFSSQESC
jgi:hypothetical protein